MIEFVNKEFGEILYCSFCTKPAKYRLYGYNPYNNTKSATMGFCRTCGTRLKNKVVKLTATNKRKPK